MNRQLFVTTDTAISTGEAAQTDPSLVSDGAFEVLNAENGSGGTADLTGTAAPDKMLLVRGGDNPQIEFIEKALIEKVYEQDYRAEVAQQSAIGFAGSGSAALSSGTAGDATLKVTRVERGYEPFPRVSASYGVNASDTPYKIAKELVEQFRKKKADNVFGSGTRKFVEADVLTNETTTQLQDDDATPANVTLAVTKGSRIAVATVTSGADVNLTAGFFIRIGHATEKDSPVYVAEAIATNTGAQTEINITLDRPYIGDTATGVAAGGGGAAPASDDEIGVLITALASEDGEPAISFRTSASGTISGDTITSVATPQTGIGLNAQMKELEKLSWGSRGYYYTNYFPDTPDSNVAASTNYDIFTIVYKNNNDNAVVKQNEFRQIHIAYPEGNVDLTELVDFFNS